MRKFRTIWRARVFTLDLIKRMSISNGFDVNAKAGGIVLSDSDVVVHIIPRRFRCLDSVVVRYQEIDVWVSLLSRLQLRRVVRCLLAEAAQNSLYGLSPQ
jgi:hypothetical protein